MAMARKGPEADALEAKSDPNGMLRIWRQTHGAFRLTKLWHILETNTQP